MWKFMSCNMEVLPNLNNVLKYWVNFSIYSYLEKCYYISVYVTAWRSASIWAALHTASSKAGDINCPLIQMKWQDSSLMSPSPWPCLCLTNLNEAVMRLYHFKHRPPMLLSPAYPRRQACFIKGHRDTVELSFTFLVCFLSNWLK